VIPFASLRGAGSKPVTLLLLHLPHPAPQHRHAPLATRCLLAVLQQHASRRRAQDVKHSRLSCGKKVMVSTRIFLLSARITGRSAPFLVMATNALVRSRPVAEKLLRPGVVKCVVSASGARAIGRQHHSASICHDCRHATVKPSVATVPRGVGLGSDAQAHAHADGACAESGALPLFEREFNPSKPCPPAGCMDEVRPRGCRWLAACRQRGTVGDVESRHGEMLAGWPAPSRAAPYISKPPTIYPNCFAASSWSRPLRIRGACTPKLGTRTPTRVTAITCSSPTWVRR
jgi:hypothetical protein